MTTYNFTVDAQFLISGIDASGAFSNESYPTISGSLGDVTILDSLETAQAPTAIRQRRYLIR